MRDLSPSVQAALEARTLYPRDFMRITARRRDTGAPVVEAWWSDLGAIEAQVENPYFGTVETVAFQGVGNLVSISAIPLVSNLTVQTVSVSLSQLDGRVNDLLRVYDVRQARVEIYRGLFNPAAGGMVAPASLRFLGFVDGAPVETPAEGGTGSVTLDCVSHLQELTRANPATRSDADQAQRMAGDTFFNDAPIVADLDIRWGGRVRRLSSTKGND